MASRRWSGLTSAGWGVQSIKRLQHPHYAPRSPKNAAEGANRRRKLVLRPVLDSHEVKGPGPARCGPNHQLTAVRLISPIFTSCLIDQGIEDFRRKTFADKPGAPASCPTTISIPSALDWRVRFRAHRSGPVRKESMSQRSTSGMDLCVLVTKGSKVPKPFLRQHP